MVDNFLTTGHRGVSVVSDEECQVGWLFPLFFLSPFSLAQASPALRVAGEENHAAEDGEGLSGSCLCGLCVLT